MAAKPRRRLQVTLDEKGKITARMYVATAFGPEEHGAEAVTNRDLTLLKKEEEELAELLEGVLEKYAPEVDKAARKDAAQQNYLAEVRGTFDRPPEQSEAPASLETRPHKKAPRKEK